MYSCLVFQRAFHALRSRAIFVFSAVLIFFSFVPCGKASFWLHTFRTRYTCIAVLFFSALFTLKDRGIFVSSVLSCFPFFPVEKRASGFTLLERDIHV